MKPLLFDYIPCSRCGGSGKYSYCQTYGDTCFQCHGTGSKLTKRGEAAQQFLNEMRWLPASTFKVGDSVFFDSIYKRGFAKIIEIIVGKGSDFGYLGNAADHDMVSIKTPIGSLVVSSDHKLRKGFSADEKKSADF